LKGDKCWLQCGHSQKAVENWTVGGVCAVGTPRFNAATARRPWRTSLITLQVQDNSGLQCGHSQKAVENDSDDGHGRE